MKYSAILFDLDGTLVDTIDFYEEAVTKAMKPYEIPVTPEIFYDWYTQGKHFEEIFVEHGIDEAVTPEFRKLRDKEYIELLCKTGWRDGAEKVLKDLKGRVPLGIVTGSWKTYIDAIEKCLGIESYADALITADDMGKLHKPHPHSLLLAADRLNAEPESCIYIGDQRFDMQAARNAGMASCLVISKHTPKDAIQFADQKVEKLEELLRIFS